MNKSELVAAIAEKSELSKKDAEKALKAFSDVVSTSPNPSFGSLVKIITDPMTSPSLIIGVITSSYRLYYR